MKGLFAAILLTAMTSSAFAITAGIYVDTNGNELLDATDQKLDHTTKTEIKTLKTIFFNGAVQMNKTCSIRSEKRIIVRLGAEVRTNNPNCEYIKFNGYEGILIKGKIVSSVDRFHIGDTYDQILGATTGQKIGSKYVEVSKDGQIVSAATFASPIRSFVTARGYILNQGYIASINDLTLQTQNDDILIGPSSPDDLEPLVLSQRGSINIVTNGSNTRGDVFINFATIQTGRSIFINLKGHDNEYDLTFSDLFSAINKVYIQNVEDDVYIGL